ncbi:hypothetical protein K438DRAFT_1864847 [Mycena galopus ATCC 62051]|nr:hypothetical protein K438DRAFT_1864847 [Mycena galopus ATCC 62051]
MPASASSSKRKAATITSPEPKKRKGKEKEEDSEEDPTASDARKKGVRGILAALKDESGADFEDAYKAFMAAGRSFSQSKYDEVMGFFGIADALEEWKALDVPDVLLPTSVIDELTKRAILAHVSPGPPSVLKNEAATAAFLGEPYRNRIFGREQALLFDRELKLEVDANFHDGVAQVSAELYASWHANRRTNKDIARKCLIPVRACLCDARNYYFIGFNGQFSQRTFRIPTTASLKKHVDMTLKISCFAFSILLDGYNHAIRMYGQRSIRRGEIGDTAERGSGRAVYTPPQPPAMIRSIERDSTKDWEKAVKLGAQSSSWLHRAHQIDSQTAAEKGLNFLYASVSAWPATSRMSKGWPEPLLPADVAVLHDELMQKHQARLKEDLDPNWDPQIPDDLLRRNLQDPQQKAMDAFWRSLRGFPSDVRSQLEARMGNDIQKQFQCLAFLACQAAMEPRSEVLEYEKTHLLTIMGSEYLVATFLGALGRSEKEELWNI